MASIYDRTIEWHRSSPAGTFGFMDLTGTATRHG